MAIILFDIDGVLIHGYHANPRYRRCWDENLERDFGINRTAFTEQFIKGVFVRDVLIGQKSLHSALAETMPALGYHGPIEPLIDYWLENDSRINMDLLPYIQKLAAHPAVSLYIATNQEQKRADYLMNNLGFGQYFKDIFNSGRIGFMKPDARFYESVTSHLKPENNHKIIFFDDTPAVIEAAKKAGWHAHQFDTTTDLFKSATVRDLLA